MKKLFGAILLVAIIAGCGSAQQPSSTSPRAETASSASPTSTANGSTANPSPSAPSFAELVRVGASASYKITYHYTASGPSGTSSADQTTYVKGTKLRWDFSQAGSAASMFFLEDGTYFCAGGSGRPVTCLKAGPAQQAPPNVGMTFTEQLRSDPTRFATTTTAGRAIAGLAARCFSLADTALAGTGIGTACYSAQGLPLFVQFKSPSADFQMEATNVGAVADADFVLPAPVRAFP